MKKIRKSGSKAWNRKMATRFHQRAAKGKTLSPRSLARSMAKALNEKQGAKRNEIDLWRQNILQILGKKPGPKHKIVKVAQN